jgi:hypothetical protein
LIDTENKLGWCEQAEVDERHFVMLFGHTLNLMVNPEKEKNKFVPDLMHKKNRTVCELKIRRTPFFTAHMKYAVSIQHAVTINKGDIEYYQKEYPGLPVYWWVQWNDLKYGDIEVKPMHGVWGIRLEELAELCDKGPLHEYERRKNDTTGNAKESYVISLENMTQLWSQ